MPLCARPYVRRYRALRTGPRAAWRLHPASRRHPVPHEDGEASSCAFTPGGRGVNAHDDERDRSGGDGEPGGAIVLEGGDVVDVAQRQTDVVEALHQPPAGVVVDLEGRLDPRG